MLEKRQALEEKVSFETGRVPPKVGSWNGEDINKGESLRCNDHHIFTAATASQIGTEVQWPGFRCSLPHN